MRKYKFLLSITTSLTVMSIWAVVQAIQFLPFVVIFSIGMGSLLTRIYFNPLIREKKNRHQAGAGLEHTEPKDNN